MYLKYKPPLADNKNNFHTMHPPIQTIATLQKELNRIDKTLENNPNKATLTNIQRQLFGIIYSLPRHANHSELSKQTSVLYKKYNLAVQKTKNN